MKQKPYEVLGFRGKKGLWRRFVLLCKRRKQKVWEVLEPFILSELEKGDKNKK